MSLFQSATSWQEQSKQCGAPGQSPINLSQSFAKSCDLLCELAIDDVTPGTAEMIGSTERGLTLTYKNAPPTCKFNSDGYTAKGSMLFHPSQHTVEGVQAQAEFVTYFGSPTGKSLAVSVLVRTSPNTSPSSTFFNTFVPFLTQPDEVISVTLGDNWKLADVIPDTPNYYVYDGTDVLPGCQPMTWVVFSDTVNMDPSDFAMLAARMPAGSRPLQQVGEDREVFFNNSDELKGSDAANKRDGKVYMKCRRLGPKQETSDVQPVKSGGLGQAAAEQTIANLYERVNSTLDPIVSSVKSEYNNYGPLGVLTVVLFVAFGYYLFFTIQGGSFVTSTLYTLESIFYYVFRYPWEWIIGFFLRKPSQQTMT
jgi:carbonic anhydrase